MMVMDCCGQILSSSPFVAAMAKIELARFSGVYTKTVVDVQALVNQTTVPEDELEKRVASQNTRETSTVPERAQRYKLYLTRARAQLENGTPK
jgi:hypothetical protein